MADNETTDRLRLIERLQQGNGSQEEVERWLEQLKAITPWFSASDFMLQLETTVRAGHLQKEHTAEVGQRLSREDLVPLVRKLQNAVGADEEQAAWLTLLERNVPHPGVSDLVYWSNEELTAEEVVDRALAYQAIILGPASSPGQS
jgi:hypothetical protein